MGADAIAEQRRWLAPEVVQTSAMDCGPAALKCLLEGYDIPVSYGRLREACQTDVDGTSIDTLEEVALQLGLDASQVVIPADHLLLPDSRSLPALVVVVMPDGMTHFVVVWRLHGRWVQIMDPATGRRWVNQQQFIGELYSHRQPVPAADWREWAGSDEFTGPLRQRLAALGIEEVVIDELVVQASAEPDWYALAALDAATRMVATLVRADALTEGEEAGRVLKTFYAQSCEQIRDDPTALSIPESYWSVSPLPPDPEQPTESWLLLKGAVMIQILGRKAEEESADEQTPAPALSLELAAALDETAKKPERVIFDLLRADGLLAPSVLFCALILASVAVVIEALLFRGLLELGQGMGLVDKKVPALLVLFIFLIAMLLLELPISISELRIGRRLENRLRMRFMEKIPRLHDRYFSSRLTSDMAHRVYELRELRDLPQLAVLFLRTNFELLLTTAGLIWLHPDGAHIAVLALVATVGIWVVCQPHLIERDLKLRTHEGALSRFYLDALLGLTPIRTHGAEKAVRREHEGLLVQWVRASLSFYRSFTAIQAIAALVGVLFSVWLLFSYLGRGGELSGVLLLFYWALRLPALGQELARTLQQYPMQRNRALRLLEPLDAPEEAVVMAAGPGPEKAAEIPAAEPPVRGIEITLEQLHVNAGGHPILQDIDVTIGAGEHVAVVGPSGAGKSSLVGLLLGWHRPAGGRILVDKKPLDGERLMRLRRETAWVDPAVQIWNRSLLDNLRYGNEDNSTVQMNAAIDRADLFGVLQRLPDGLQAVLGEGGGLVSGGEGQRVRLGRAMLRENPRLVILDEPFRGLDRAQRRDLLTRAREYWREATLIFISHDVGDTQDFDRVLVLEDGHIVEDANPVELARRASRYRVLLDAEQAVREDLWASADWRRLQLRDGALVEEPSAKN